MIDSACAGRRPVYLGAASPCLSLAWTSLRTPNGWLGSPRARRAECSPLDLSSRAAREEPIREEINRRCAGWDVHQESVEACVRRIDENGRWQQQTRPWGTMTRDLWALADGMTAPGVTPVAMESTGGSRSPISWRAASGCCR